MSTAPTSAPAERDPGLEYFGALRVSLDAAAAAAGGFVEEDLVLAGVGVRLRFAGDAMRDQLLPPLVHLATGERVDPAVRIGVFDAASTGVPAPPFPWAPIETDLGANPVARYEGEKASVLVSMGTGAITAADAMSGEGIFFLPDAKAVPPTERAAPLREALHLLMASQGRWMTHAGAVGRGGHGVLLVGPSGSGKSTLALSCALAGMELVGDDYVLIEVGEPPIAHALQSTAKLTADSAARLGLEASDLDPVGFEVTIEGAPKAMAEVESIAPGTMRGSLAVGALIAPSLPSSAAPELVPISPAQGFRSLAPSTVLQMRSRAGNAAMFAMLARLSREVPSYDLRLSTDAAANAAAVAEVVAGLG